MVKDIDINRPYYFLFLREALHLINSTYSLIYELTIHTFPFKTYHLLLILIPLSPNFLLAC